VSGVRAGPWRRPVAAWLRRWHERRAGDDVLLSVCYGAAVVASAGLLDGHDATSAWLRLPGLERRHRAVAWRRGTRYVDDGEVVSTGAVLSAVDGTLRVVERLLGAGAAAASARSVGWRHYAPGGPGPLPGPALPWRRATPSPCSTSPTAGTRRPSGSCSPAASASWSWRRRSAPPPSSPSPAAPSP
jgi:transcriptional regulator GlxA family with amidase domain